MKRPTEAWKLESLSAQDRLFLLCETQTTHMHVGAVLLSDNGPLAKPDGSIDFKRIREHIAGRLKHIPRYRQRISFQPIPGRPHWVDDERFDLDRHLLHLRLPNPGSDEQLRQLCGRIFAEPLDHRRPLWQIAVIEGLRHGRFALVAKTHHCLVDGIGGVHLLAALLDPDPTARTEPHDLWKPTPAPTPGAVIQLDLAGQIEQARELASQAAQFLRAPRDAVSKLSDRAAAISRFLGTGLTPAPASPLNQPIGKDRSFAWLTFELNEVKQIKRQVGGTINDVVLATVAGGLRHFFRRSRKLPRPDDLRALVPVNMRGEGDDCALGNHISAMLVSLPVSVADPKRRMREVVRRMQAAKASKQAIGGQSLAGVGVPLLAALMRVADRLQPFNLVVTNVPGPPLPLYLAGARVRAVLPQVPLFVNQGLGVALFSYAGNLHCGLTADPDVVPDLRELQRAIADAFDELCSVCSHGRSEATVLPFPQARAS